jgi:hypothetical protein
MRKLLAREGYLSLDLPHSTQETSMTHAKKSVLAITALMALALFASGAFAAAPPAAGLDQIFSAAPPFPLYGDLTYCWGCGGCGVTGVTLNADHTYTTSEGEYGTWTFSRPTRTLTLQYGLGCYPTYTLTYVSGRHFEGTMVCTQGSGDGCAAFDFTGHGAPSNSHRSANGTGAGVK